ncbi:MAG: hypothetical protein JST05_10265 [Acidobacteria bacterium]|nr:hypothetical protein [Acidobacteriota bacterium]
MTDIEQVPAQTHEEDEGPISVRQILKENWILARCVVFLILMLFVPLIIAWKLNLFLVANN